MSQTANQDSDLSSTTCQNKLSEFECYVVDIAFVIQHKMMTILKTVYQSLFILAALAVILTVISDFAVKSFHSQ